MSSHLCGRHFTIIPDLQPQLLRSQLEPYNIHPSQSNRTCGGRATQVEKAVRASPPSPYSSAMAAVTMKGHTEATLRQLEFLRSQPDIPLPSTRHIASQALWLSWTSATKQGVVCSCSLAPVPSTDACVCRGGSGSLLLCF